MDPRDDPFAILGIDSSASEEEVEDAYRRLVQIFHPDRYATAPEDVRTEAERRMKALNEARDAIKSGYRPRSLSSEEEKIRRAYSAATDYSGPFCLLCGHAPVAGVELKVGVGKVLSRGVGTWAGSLCRMCGQAMYRDMQNETLLKGWWGIIAFFANFAYVFNNWRASKRIAQLGQPTPTPASLITPIDQPIPPTKPLTHRLGVWVTFALFALIVTWYINNLNVFDPDTLSIGDCFSLDAVPKDEAFDTLKQVPCESSGNIAELFAREKHPGTGAYPGEERLSSFADFKCEQLAGEHAWDAFIPTEESWDLGEREVLCYFPLE